MTKRIIKNKTKKRNRTYLNALNQDLHKAAFDTALVPYVRQLHPTRGHVYTNKERMYIRAMSVATRGEKIILPVIERCQSHA